jgi:hypothetical protein
VEVLLPKRSDSGPTRIVPFRHCGEDVPIYLPTEVQISQELRRATQLKEGGILPTMPLKQQLERLMNEVLEPLGIPAAQIDYGQPGAVLSAAEHDNIWRLFEPWYRQFLMVFPDLSPGKQAEIASVVRALTAVMRTIIASERFNIAEDRRLFASQAALGVNTTLKQADDHEYAIKSWERETNLIVELLALHDWEHDLFPGEGERTGDFLPAEDTGIEGGGGGGGGPSGPEDVGVREPTIFGDLIVVPLDDQRLGDSQYQVYKDLGCKLVLMSPNRRNLCFPIRRRDKAMIVSVEPTPKRLKNAAAYFFYCGKPGDPPEQLKSWLADVARPRLLVRTKRTEVAPTLIDIIDHKVKIENKEGHKVTIEVWPDKVHNLVNQN